MALKVIPEDVKREMAERIEAFNRENFKDQAVEIAYLAEYRGKYLYLKRREDRNILPVARLTYTGNKNNWEFSIFKWSTERYSPDEWFFPGVEHVDGTIEGAMMAGMEASPI